MKKILIILVVTALSLTLVSSSINAKMVEPTINKQKININNEMHEISSYVVNEENYVKLRDVAKLLVGTDMEFGIAYDVSNSSISLQKNEKYNEVGGELAPLPDTKIEMKDSFSNIYLDGNKVNLKGYIFGSNNFYRLRDIANVFEWNINYDEKDKIVTIAKNGLEIKNKPEDDDKNDTEIKDEKHMNNNLPFTIISTTNKGNLENVSWTNSKNTLYVSFTMRFNTGGYSVGVKEIIRKGDDIIITPIIKGPLPSEQVLQVITYKTVDLEIPNIKDFKGRVIVEGLESESSIM